MLNREIKENLPIRILKSVFGDVILIYTALIMTAIMYHYRSSLALAYGAAALIITALIFRLFDFIASHKIIGSAAYIAVLSAFIFSARLCIDTGSKEYPISFMVWFLTPQDALDYSRWYTLAMFLFFMIFTASVVYYFTKIRYRIFMNFLIFIIPFAIYGKEYEKMPTVFIMLLAIGYVVTMIRCRQLSDNAETVVVQRKKLWKSIGIYVVIFASAAAIVPKPHIEANREYIEKLISAEEFTDKLLAMVSVFKDTTGGEAFRSLSDEAILYFVRSDEPLRLKTLTFTEYDYESDSWSVSSNDTRFKYRSDDKSIEAPKADELIRAIALAAETDSSFAEKYGLEDFSADELKTPDTSEITIYTTGLRAQYAPVPPFAERLVKTSYEGSIAVTKSGLVYCVENYFSSEENFTYEYSSYSFLTDEENRSLINLMSRDDYYDMLYDASRILGYQYSEQAELLSDHYWQSEDFDVYLDYGDNARIYELASELTSGLDSDYDKAVALESYFYENGFLYDMDYKKDKGENAEDFIFESKRGVCYEYATAMVLLARAAGIPARYAEGYNMYEEYSNQRLGTNYVIKGNAAHGFPELYIRGVGWVSFEPTVSDIAESGKDNAATENLLYAGIILLAAALVLLLAVMLYPAAVHRVFLIRVKRMSGSDAAIRIMKRICGIYKLSSSMTSQEAAAKVSAESGCNADYLAELFDRAVYGEYSVSEEEKQRALMIYLDVYQARRRQKKWKYGKLGHNT